MTVKMPCAVRNVKLKFDIVRRANRCMPHRCYGWEPKTRPGVSTLVPIFPARFVQRSALRTNVLGQGRWSLHSHNIFSQAAGFPDRVRVSALFQGCRRSLDRLASDFVRLLAQPRSHARVSTRSIQAPNIARDSNTTAVAT